MEKQLAKLIIGSRHSKKLFAAPPQKKTLLANSVCADAAKEWIFSLIPFPQIILSRKNLFPFFHKSSVWKKGGENVG